MITLVLILISLWCYLQWKWRRFYKLSKVLKHNLLSLPFIGAGYLFLGDGKAILRGIDTMGKEAYKQGGLTSFWFGFNYFVVFAEPVSASFVSQSTACLEKHDIMKNCLKPIFKNSHLIAPVPMWRHARRIAIPLFTTSRIKNYAPVFMEQSNLLVEKLQSIVGQPVFMFDRLLKHTLEILLQVALEVRFDLQNTKENSFVTGIEESAEIIGGRFFKPWLYNNFIYQLLPEYKTVTNYANEAFALVHKSMNLKRNYIEGICKDTVRRQTSVKSFVEHYVTIATTTKKINDTEIVEELLGLIMAGSDTTSISACFCISLLAHYSDVQDKLYEEINEQLPPGSSIDDVLNLKYLDAVIKETLRLYSPTPVIVRTLEKDITLPSGIVLPEGCGLFLHLRAINKNPEYWGPDAEEFRPERFLEHKLKHSAQFIPFSFGPRNCVGNRFAVVSLKVTIATIVRNLRIYPATDLKGKRTDFKLSYGITIKDDNDFPVMFQSRD